MLFNPLLALEHLALECNTRDNACRANLRFPFVLSATRSQNVPADTSLSSVYRPLPETSHISKSCLDVIHNRRDSIWPEHNNSDDGKVPKYV